jgi:transcription antitermination protein NusB
VDKSSIKEKRRARRLALQALYQWLMSKQELTAIEAQFKAFKSMEKVDADYFCKILYGVPKHLEALDAHFSPFLDREVQALNPIELTVLRLGAFELVYCLDLPYRVILDEAISMTKEFGSQDGHRYVNGVLNNLARKLRPNEVE